MIYVASKLIHFKFFLFKQTWWVKRSVAALLHVFSPQAPSILSDWLPSGPFVDTDSLFGNCFPCFF